VRRGLILVALLATSVATAASDSRRRVALLDVVAEGLAPDVRAQFETIIEEALRRTGNTVISRSVTIDAVARKELPEGCTFGPCVAGIAQVLDADRLLDARLNAEGDSYSFVLTFVDGRSGTPLAQVVGSCPVCTVSEALNKVGASIPVLEGRAVSDSQPLVARMAPRHPRSHALAGWLTTLAGLAAAGGGAALVALTSHDAPGWVTIGAGGAVAMTGFVILVGD
jgi:hypothetical protein